MAWTFYNSSGEALTSFGPMALTDLDIDGGTAIGEAVVGADLFIADNGAGGTNVKVTATEIATFIDTNASGGAKAWVSYDYSGGAPAIQGGSSGSYTVASLGDDGTGHIQVNYTNNMDGVHYAVLFLPSATAPRFAGSTQLAASCDVKVWNSSDAAADLDGSVVVFGVLA